MAIRQFEGGCHCGAVRYALARAPSGSMLCHCRTCRHLSGAPVVAWITVARRDFSIVHGLPGTYASSDAVRRTFCTQCGTPLTYAHAREPGMLDVTTCSLDLPEAWPPRHHAWTRHDLAWVAGADPLPRFADQAPDDPP